MLNATPVMRRLMVGGTVCGRVSALSSRRLFRFHTRTDPSCAPATKLRAMGIEGQAGDRRGVTGRIAQLASRFGGIGIPHLYVPSLPAEAICAAVVAERDGADLALRRR